MNRIAILTNVIPKYRKGFYDRIFNQDNKVIKVFCQKDTLQKSLKSVDYLYPSNVETFNNTNFFKGAFVWQNIPCSKILRNYDIIFVDGNIRHINQFIFAMAAKAIGKKVVIWSVAYSRNDKPFFRNIRLFLWRYFDYFLMYNENDVANLKKNGFENKKIISINNSLDQDEIENAKKAWSSENLQKWQIKNKFENKAIILTSGRIESGRFDIIIPALKLLKVKIPNILWIIVGDGNYKAQLEKALILENLDDYICFAGAIYDEQKLAPYFLSSKLFVYPCPIGLSIFHAYGYGLPVILNDNVKTQGPEYIAFENGITGLNFRENDMVDLTEKIITLFNNDNLIKKINAEVLKKVNTEFNINIMVDRFIKMVNN